ncbi:putative ATP-dependent helicase [Desulfitobacterium hafniense DCB-2]|uniref:Uncharacterized protein n=2 Tax=root TaxID=1 RepID=A0A644SZ04_9ZZZZ|nr:AAA family ATPase [Desulfitobacterium hafniense]ACL22019.1 putative ATP-dependent helicase [Desulfitobacterium hafniense DCB-2]MEA5022393.1 AAA family ATPase [Desulfitobacterium hafniense]
MSKNYFYSQVEINEENALLIEALRTFANDNSIQTYAILEPLGEEKYNYDYKNVVNVLIPGYKILIVNVGKSNDEKFEYFCEDFIEDLSHLSDKFTYKDKIGRPRDWKRNQIELINYENFDAEDFIEKINIYKLSNPVQKRISELLISLLIGSINPIVNIGIDEPENILDKVKQKIVLFDSDQTRFIFEKVNERRIVIQGLAGTGKTELLLHKLKELYVRESKSKISFTCHSKTLSSNLRMRVPQFFTFMRVEEQIQWNERLWVHGSWGSQNYPHSGLYALICNRYGIPFQRYSRGKTFAGICADAVKFLKQRKVNGDLEPYFDYILIDESQDFTEEFFELCEMVTKKAVYIAGDIFQNIFDNDYSKVDPDFLLNKCYRTDPRTLMFSHAIGLALFERPVVNWLSDREWEACGYQIRKNNDNYRLTREKIRRFEDIEDMQEIKPVELYCVEYDNILNKIISLIGEIKAKHSTVKPDDIAIVFVDDSNSIYRMIDVLGVLIRNEFNWEINRGYDNKGQIEDTLFISNRNNIKGLEFPFLICVVTNEIEKNIKSRNTLYMTLTRSFISSYLVMSTYNSDLFEIWNPQLEGIIKDNSLSIVRPEPEDIMSKEQLQINDPTYKTYQEIVEELFLEFKIPIKKREKMLKILDAYATDDSEILEEGLIRMIIEKNLELINGKDN